MDIIISEKTDPTANKVLFYLLGLKNNNLKRINTENSTNFSFKIIKKGEMNLEIDGFVPYKIWNRRGYLNFLKRNPPVSLNTYNYLKKEADVVVKASELFLKEKIDYIGSFIKETENYKPYQLQIAVECGLNIPATLITNSKKKLLAFKQEHKKIVCKDLRYPVHIAHKDKKLISTGTLMVKESMLKDLGDNFAPMLFQHYVEKEYEIRVFFFKDDYYAMAIFSQNNEKTKIDFRNYDKEEPNRCVPVKLPTNIQKKLEKFSKKYDLNTGSIDLIKSTTEDYIFLEVNPQGQLDWLSKNCNYYIEKRIANFFINE